MNNLINCPKCQTENPRTSNKCVNCGYLFENVDNEDRSSETSENWLDSLRKTGELRESSLESENDQFKPIENDKESDSTPDWLKRIQELNDAEHKLQDKHASEASIEESIDIDDKDIEDIEDKDIGELDRKDKDVNYQWLEDFRNTSEIEDQSDMEKHPLSSEETIDEDSKSQQPLLTIDEVKKDWQNEFPSLSENLDEEDISPAEDLPDWLNGDLKINDETDQNFEEHIEENIEENIPNWLSTQSEQSSEVDELPPESQESNELPTWLSHREEPTIDSLEKASTSDASIPEWLQKINAAKNNIEPEIHEGKSLEEVEDEENVLNSDLLFNKLEINLEPDKEQTGDKDTDQIPYDSEKKETEDELFLSSPAFIFTADDLISKKPFHDDEESPLWNYEDSMEDREEEEYQSQTDYSEKPDKGEIDAQVLSGPFAFDDIPEWLDKVDLNYSDIDSDVLASGDDEEKQEKTEPDTASSADISKAKLPEWLKSIRPIEVVTPDVSKIKSSKKIENTGPLAGFKGVLSTENIANTYTPPPSYSINLNISDKQRMHVKLLEGIISPTNVQEIKTIDKKPSTFMAILIPIVFLAIMIFSLFLDTKTFNSPVDFPAETVRFHNLITGYLNQNQEAGNILLITEVDSSAYPEINLISTGVLENIFLNNHWVTALSTNPNGVIVSDNILNNASMNVPAYNYSERVINLGYIPGNYLGIHSFLVNPQKSIPYDLKKQKVWTETHLSNLNSVSDFDLIMLIADNSDNARLWIEQIELMQPEIGFLVISTTQSSPLLKPYVKSDQIDGMIAGIYGGLAFNLLARTDTTDLNRYWSMNQIAVYVIILFILIGVAVIIYSNFKQSIPNKKNK